MTRAGFATILSLLVTLAPLAARAQSAQETAQQHFDRGAKLYNLGHFQEAIPEFEKAYDLDSSPIFLFNIAQSHRQLGNKERALFFYRRYLEQAPNAANRDDVERRMKDLEASLQQEAELKQKPPPGVSDHVAPNPGGAATPVPPVPPPPAGGAVAPGPTEPAAPSPAGPSWIAGLQLGPAFLSMGGPSGVDLPTIFSARLEGAYVVQSVVGELRLGVDLGYAQLPFTRATPGDPGSSGTSAFWSVLATVRYLFHVTPAFRLGAGVRGGSIWWSGLDLGNPFTVQGVAASGAIPMPSIGGGLRLEVTVVEGLFLALSPEVLWSKSTSDGLSQNVSSVTRFELTAGVGYAF